MHDKNRPILLLCGLFDESATVLERVHKIADECGWSVDEEQFNSADDSPVDSSADARIALVLVGGQYPAPADLLRAVYPRALIVRLDKSCEEGSSDVGFDLYFRKILPARV